MRVLRRGFSRADWVGDGIVTLALGGAVAAGVFLPWANLSTGHDVNLSPRATLGVNAALATPWGRPVLVLALVVAAVGVIMVLARPTRLARCPAWASRWPVSPSRSCASRPAGTCGTRCGPASACSSTRSAASYWCRPDLPRRWSPTS